MNRVFEVESNAAGVGLTDFQRPIQANTFRVNTEAKFSKDVRISGALKLNYAIKNFKETNYAHINTGNDMLFNYVKVGCQCYIYGRVPAIYDGRSEVTKICRIPDVMIPSHKIIWFAGNVPAGSGLTATGDMMVCQIDTDGWLSILWTCANNTAAQSYGTYSSQSSFPQIDIQYCVDNDTPLEQIATADGGTYILYNCSENADLWTAKNTSVYTHPNTYSYSLNSKYERALAMGSSGGSSRQYGWFYTPTLTVPSNATKLIMTGYTPDVDTTIYLGLNTPNAGRQFNNFIVGNSYAIGSNRNKAISLEVDVSAYRGVSTYGVVVGASHSGAGTFYCKKVWFEP